MSPTISAEHASADPQAAALSYAGRGWRVLPLYESDTQRASGCICQDPHSKSLGKHPRTNHSWTDWTEDSVVLSC